MSKFAIELRGDVDEVGREHVSSGPGTSKAVISTHDSKIVVGGLCGESARLLAGHLYRRVRITIEPVED